MQYQKYLSLRVLVLQPLVITFIMLASTAALVRGEEGHGGALAREWWGAIQRDSPFLQEGLRVGMGSLGEEAGSGCPA